jgi:5-methylthioadenosine/S-adenosylhomocysteine deaminase
VLTLGARTPNYRQADVLIEDDRVIEVGAGLRSREAEIIDASDTIVMPGFVDAHRHAWRTLVRGLGDHRGEPASPVLYGPHHQPDDVYAATLAGLYGALEAGITSVVDWADIPSGTAFTEAALQAHADAGIRGVFVRAHPAWSDEESEPTALTGERRPSARGITGVAAGSPDVTAASRAKVAAAWEAARRDGLRIHAHAGVGDGDRGSVADLGSAGLLGDDVTLIHCTTLGDADLDAIAGAGTGVVLAPASEMSTGLGAPRIVALVDRGIRPGLGVDDERMAPGDILAQMRTLISLHHAAHFELKLVGKAGLSNLLTTRETIRQGTIDGASAIGNADIVGSLEPGKQADIVVLRTDRPNIWPVNDPIGAVVWGMDTSNVDWVFVAGRPLVRHGQTDADLGRVRKLAREAQQRVTEAAGLTVSLAGGTDR